VAVELDAELVGVEVAPVGGQHRGVAVGVVDDLVAVERVPVMILECQYEAQPSFMILVCACGQK
jgi:hypothetical protein